MSRSSSSIICSALSPGTPFLISLLTTSAMFTAWVKGRSRIACTCSCPGSSGMKARKADASREYSALNLEINPGSLSRPRRAAPGSVLQRDSYPLEYSGAVPCECQRAPVHACPCGCHPHQPEESLQCLPSDRTGGGPRQESRFCQISQPLPRLSPYGNFIIIWVFQGG